MNALYTVQRNHCDCHPETCCCNKWAIYKQDNKYVTLYDKEKAKEIAEMLNAASNPAPVEQAAPDVSVTNYGDIAAPVTVPIAWGDVVKAIRAVDDEARQRGSMFPQEADEHAADRAATRRVVEMIKWYATCGGAVAEKLKDWPRYTLAAAPAPSADAQDTKRLDLIQSKGYELSSDHDEDEPWVVHRVSGSPNDREWHEVGRGETVRAAIDAALSAQKEGE